MASAWICLTLGAVLAVKMTTAIFIGGEQDVASPLRVAQCRATCLERFSNDGPNGESMCLQGPDCFMCWENCELLQSNFQVWGAMCEEKEICFPGCQEACRFHAEASTRVHQTQPVIHTKGEGVIKVLGPLAKWPRPVSVSSSTPLIYVVMRKSQSGPWRQIIQTLDLTTRVPLNSDQAGSTLRVLVVDPQGLVTIYSPDENSVRENKKKKKTINTEIKATTSKTPVTDADEKWTLREVSLIHQKVLVIGEIAWDPKTSRGVYLVTWEVDGGGLKGNLFTDSTCVTLSLWPDTVYHIQVELVSHTPGLDNLKSEMMDLDTGRAQKVSTESQEDLNIIPGGTGKDIRENIEFNSPLLSVLVSAVKGENNEHKRHNLEMLAGSGAAVVLFVILLVIVLWRCRYCSGTSADNIFTGSSSVRSQKLIEDFTAYKGFQPIMTVVSRVNEKPRGELLTQCDGGSTVAPTPDVAFLGTPQQQQPTPIYPSDTEDTTAFLQEAERTARNEVQV
ncbi:forked end [Carabus blaptoides fortunei]